MALFVARRCSGRSARWSAQWQQIIVAGLGRCRWRWAPSPPSARRNIKRLMAYSSIGHVGYALIGLAAGTRDGRARRADLHGDLRRHERSAPSPASCAMRRSGRWSRASPTSPAWRSTSRCWRLAMAIFMFSLAGIPPLAGFFGKLYVFLAAIEAGLYVARGGRRARQRGRRLLLPAHRQGDVLRRAGRGARPAARRRPRRGCSLSARC